MSAVTSGTLEPVDEVEEEEAITEAAAAAQVKLGLGELTLGQTLGCGAFGRVRLALHPPTGTKYALKCLVKSEIVKNNLMRHVSNERAVMLQVSL
jgi:serine/threonine protein kinase